MSAIVVREPAMLLSGGNSSEEHELDAAIQELGEHLKEAEGGHWKMAVTLRRILDENLWQLRTSAEGGPRHRSFKDFVEAETELTYSHAFKLAHVARAGSEAYRRFGLRKLYAIACAPEAAHAELRAACEAGKPAVEIERRARDARLATRKASHVVAHDAGAGVNELVETSARVSTDGASEQRTRLADDDVEATEPPLRLPPEAARWPETVSVDAERDGEARYVARVRLRNGLVVKISVELPNDNFDDAWFTLEVDEVAS